MPVFIWGRPVLATRYQAAFVVFFRLVMAWTFLYAASRQVLNPHWDIGEFLNRVRTFHDVYGVFAGAMVVSIIAFLVAWGHLLIGVSLLVGLMVRVSASVGGVLMLLYWAAFMDFPYVGDADNFIVDFHLVYAALLFYLAAVGAGRVVGLDAWVGSHPAMHRNPRLKPLFG